MLSKLFYYGKENNKKTILSIFVLLIAIFMGVLPFLFTYQILLPVIHDVQLTTNKIVFCTVGVLASLLLCL